MRPLSVLMLIWTVVLAGCAWTMSSKRSQRINDCIARCDAMQSDPAPDRSVGGRQEGIRDTRSDCERRCHALGE